MLSDQYIRTIADPGDLATSALLDIVNELLYKASMNSPLAYISETSFVTILDCLQTVEAGR
jgi:hypothetical protein